MKKSRPTLALFAASSDFDLERKDFGSLIITNIPFSKKKEVLQRLKDLDIPFITILPTSTINTKFLREIFDEEIQLLLPPSRIFFEKICDDKNNYKSGSVETAFFCYKIQT